MSSSPSRHLCEAMQGISIAKGDGAPAVEIQDQKHRSNDYFTLLDLPDDAMLPIASLISPVDVYNLSLTCKRFHRPASLTKKNKKVVATDDVEMTCASKNDEEVPQEPRGGEAPNALLCTKLLRVSLLQSLDYILRSNKKTPGLSLDKLNELFRYEDHGLSQGSVAISGSTMIQCVLGVAWDDSDIDIYCTPAAAAMIRSWLCHSVGQLCQDFSESYGGSEHPIPEDLGTITIALNKIHHVEHYCNRPVDGAPHASDIDGHVLPPFSYERACRNGREINQGYFPRPWQRVFYAPGNTQELMALPGDEFLFDARYSKKELYPSSFDLIVAKKDDNDDDVVQTASSILQEIVNDFDINICKVIWNGSTFIIPDPHSTFASQTRMNPKWTALMTSYQSHYVPLPSNNMPPLTFQQALAERFRRIRNAMDELPRDIFRFVLPSFEGAGDNDAIRREMQEFAFHNCMVKQFARIEKYQNRGIEILDAPPQLLDPKSIPFGWTSRELQRLVEEAGRAAEP